MIVTFLIGKHIHKKKKSLINKSFVSVASEIVIVILEIVETNLHVRFTKRYTHHAFTMSIITLSKQRITQIMITNLIQMKGRILEIH